MTKWKFPHGVDLTPSGHNNTAIEQFKDDTLNSLTREVIQNSLDALRENESTVKVEFDLYEMTSNLIPDKDEIRNNALIKAYEFWQEKKDTETIKYLDNFKKVIENDKVRVLRISDYNTTGLNDENYDSLIIGNSYSVKREQDSAGSKGIGKAAPFATSDLRMVFYNTVPTKSKPKSAGVMTFVSFIFEQKMITQERASYSDEGKNKINRQSNFQHKDRKSDEYGTDLYILGFKEYDNFNEKIILYSLNNFLISIYNENLEVTVGDEIISKENIEKNIEILENVKFTRKDKLILNKTIAFYDVLTNTKTVSSNLPESFLQYQFIKSIRDAELLLLEHEPATRTVLQVRKAGMKIYERTHVNGTINFTGIFQAKGQELNIFLKDMENANHDKWSTDRYSGDKKKEADNFLNALFKWFKGSVKDAFEKPLQDEIEAYGIAELLPHYQSGDNEVEKDSGLKNIISSHKVERKGKESAAISSIPDSDEDFKGILESIGLDDGDTSGPGSPRTGGSGGGFPSNDGAPGNNEGGKGSGSGSNIFAPKEQRVNASKNLKFKIIAMDYTNGKYKIKGHIKQGMKLCEIEFKNVGADGRVYKVLIEKASTQIKGNNVYSKNNKIYIEGLKSNQQLDIDFEIPTKLRMKMEGIVNEIKA